ncbi:MAG: AAA family ATPase [Oscillospiraceae bacterium]|nr:AAA family ATPase [Oscillospiraceae bacterium]
MKTTDVIFSVNECKTCGKKPHTNDIIYRRNCGVAEEYCSSCMDMKKYELQNDTLNQYPYIRYHVQENNIAHLVVDKWGFYALPKGAYALGQCGELDVVEEIKYSDLTPNKFAELVALPVLEVGNDSLSAIICPPSDILPVKTVAEDEHVLERFEQQFRRIRPIVKELYYILDKNKNILGVIQDDSLPSKWGFTFEYYTLAARVSIDRMCRFIRDHKSVGLSDKTIRSDKKDRAETPLKLNDPIKDTATVGEVREALKILKPDVMLSYCQQRVQGQGVQLKKAVYQIYSYLQSVAKGENFNANSWMLTAPSGSGKTEFFRTIKALFSLYKIPIPVVQIDLSQITESGYKGDNVNTIPQRIYEECPRGGGLGICFLDEADKKFVPSYGSRGADINAAIQANLLTMIEGSQVKVEYRETRRDFDSGLTMFVLMGAFQSLRSERGRKKTVPHRQIGFAADITAVEEPVTDSSEEIYSDITIQDMIDFGMQEELAGRMAQVVNFRRLSREDMRGVLYSKAKMISGEIDVQIELSYNAVEELLDISFGSLGIRRPMNIIRELAQNTIAEVFFDGDFDSTRDQVVIDSVSSAHIDRPKKGLWAKHKAARSVS